MVLLMTRLGTGGGQETYDLEDAAQAANAQRVVDEANANKMGVLDAASGARVTDVTKTQGEVQITRPMAGG